MAPESTTAAIVAAWAAGADAVELDVQMTRDGRLVIFHDERLERTTTGHGRVVASRASTLFQLDAGTWFQPRFARERVLLLSQALRLIPRSKRVNLELKPTRHRSALLRHVLRVIRHTSIAHRLLISSFDARLLKPLQSSFLARALICRTQPDRSLREAIRLGCVAWHPFHPLAIRSRIAQAHAAGLRVHVWTCDDPQQARRLIARGVDGIFTNNPARLRAVCR